MDAAPSEENSTEKLITQGAEARLYASTFIGLPAIVKERFRKLYRHPTLDERLTKERLGLEARNLVRAKRAGVCTPVPYQVDLHRSRIIMERIQGVTVKQWLLSNPSQASLLAVARCLGLNIARLHGSGMVHGDLTTSNIMMQGVPSQPPADFDVAIDSMRPLPAECLQESNAAFAMGTAIAGAGASGTSQDGAPAGAPLPYPLVFIDFGLSSTNASVEDKGVDLYVLERAVSSTHSGVAEPFFASVLEGYRCGPNGKDVSAVLAKFQQVRMRGRKRLAFG